MKIAIIAWAWLWLAALAACKAVGTPFPSLINATLDDLVEGLEEGLFTSADLVKTYLTRIDQVNATLHAVTEVNPDAIEIAEALDKERADGTVKGPLHGIPILIKNNIATKDKMNNTAGSWGLVGATVPRDSAIARKLRQAGAIILGKTNLSQWANFRSTNSSNGWSAHGGQVYAAHYPRQDPSGSSSGSGVAADLGLAFAALGTETDGSIVSPSEKSNLVGIKPSVGLTSRNLVVPISEHQDTVGPMARTVRDAAHVLQAIAGEDKQDNYTSTIPSIPDYVAACSDLALRGARIGVPWNVIELMHSDNSDVEVAAFKDALQVLRGAGATIVEANFTMAEESLRSNASTVLLDADILTNMASYLSELASNPNDLRTLSDVRDFTQGFPAESYPDRNTAIWDTSIDQQGFGNTDPRAWAAYQEALRLQGAGGLLGALDRRNASAVVLPTSMASSWAATLGAPIVTVPLGAYPDSMPVTETSRGLVASAPGVPFGLAFLGRRWSEATLIGLAHGFEGRTGVRGRVRPYVVPEAEVGDFAGKN